MKEQHEITTDSWTSADEHRLDSLLGGGIAETAKPLLAMSEFEVEQVRRATRQVWRQRLAARRWRYGSALVALAASLLVALGTVLWLRSVLDSPAATLAVVNGEVLLDGQVVVGEDLAAGTRITTGAAGHVALQLAGGAELRLDAASELQLTGRRGARLLRGAVYVAVDSPVGSAAALELWTPAGLVRDIGTRFEARLDSAGGLRLRVRDGLVLLERPAGETVEVAAGGELEVAANGALHRGATEPWDEVWSWTWRAAALPDIEGATLASFLDFVAQEAGWRILYSSAESERAAATAVLYGSLAGLDRDQALQVVLRGSGFSHQIRDGVLWVDNRPASKLDP